MNIMGNHIIGFNSKLIKWTAEKMIIGGSILVLKILTGTNTGTIFKEYR